MHEWFEEKKNISHNQRKPQILCFHSKIFSVEASFRCWIDGLMSIMIIKIRTKSTEMNMQTMRSTLFFLYYWFIWYFSSNAVYSIVVTYRKPLQVSSTLLYNLMETEVLWHSLFPVQPHVFIPFSFHSAVSISLPVVLPFLYASMRRFDRSYTKSYKKNSKWCCEIFQNSTTSSKHRKRGKKWCPIFFLRYYKYKVLMVKIIGFYYLCSMGKRWKKNVQPKKWNKQIGTRSKRGKNF